MGASQASSGGNETEAEKDKQTFKEIRGRTESRNKSCEESLWEIKMPIQKKFKFIEEHEQRARDIVKSYYRKGIIDTKKGKENKKLSIKLSKPFGDADKDGVFNIIDCEPFDPNKDGLVGDIGKAIKTRTKETYEEIKEGGLEKISGKRSREEHKEVRETEHEAFHMESKEAVKERAKERARKKYGLVSEREKIEKKTTKRGSKHPMIMSSPLTSSEPMVEEVETQKKEKTKTAKAKPLYTDIRSLCFGK